MPACCAPVKLPQEGSCLHCLNAQADAGATLDSTKQDTPSRQLISNYT